MASSDPQALIRQALEEASVARRDGDEARRRALLEGAWEAAWNQDDLVLRQMASWRLARAAFDAGDHRRMVDAIAPLVDTPQLERGVFRVKRAISPFHHYEAGLRALPRIARAFGDHEGYGEPVIDALWEAWIAHREEHDQPLMAAWGRLQLAWLYAVRGDLSEVEGIAKKLLKTPPRAFQADEHLYPGATDHDSSCARLHLDVSRVWLRAATWAGDESSAWKAEHALEDAVEDAGIDRSTDLHLQDNLLDAALRFGWTQIGETYCALVDEARWGEDPHELRVRGLAALWNNAEATDLLRGSADAAADAHAGPEWQARALFWLARQRVEGAAQEFSEVCSRFSVEMERP